MRLVDVTLKVLGISEAIRRWQGVVGELDSSRRDRIARYAEEIAASIARTATAVAQLDDDPGDKAGLKSLARELGRLNGYLETIVSCLEGRLDGRRLHGLKRRLEGLSALAAGRQIEASAMPSRIERLMSAEGYFRALADSLRATGR
jgi:hypothetical protein